MKTEKYSHLERIQMIIAGERPDRHAASCWRHFFHMEHHAEGTAEAMLGFQKEFDWDFMKINPRADYHIEDWGLTQAWSHDEYKKHAKSVSHSQRKQLAVTHLRPFRENSLGSR